MRNIVEIIIHTTATPPNWRESEGAVAKVNEIRRWHKDRGFNDIGYHFIIDRNGEVAKGRPIEIDGAHVKGRNKGTIGIALMGGIDGKATDAFLANYTPEQERALIKLIKWLHENYGVVPVTGHNQFANKECPCFDVPKWWDGVNRTGIRPEVAISGVLAGATAATGEWLGLPPAATVAGAVALAVALFFIIRKAKA